MKYIIILEKMAENSKRNVEMNKTEDEKNLGTRKYVAYARNLSFWRVSISLIKIKEDTEKNKPNLLNYGWEIQKYETIAI